jgi:transcriptional regulator with XRE-family HTH domain
LRRPSKKIVISNKEIGRRVKALRRRKGITQAELAKLLGTIQSNISNIERGARGLTVQQIVRLCKALGVSTDEILIEEKAPKEVRSLRSAKLLRCLQQIEALPVADQRMALKLLEGLLARHRVNQYEKASA